MDEQGCPRCKTTKYRNPSLKLMVNVCGHSLCDNCVDLLFIKGSGACPECGTAIRRSNFRYQIFEDPQVEKEVDIRRKVLKDYNKKEEDFNTLREYNDYLEMIETIIYNLANNIDVESTKKQVETYRKENKDSIRKNYSKLSKDEEYIEMLIEEEQQNSTIRKQMIHESELNEKNKKRREKEALIDDLMFSDMSANDILNMHKSSVNTAMEVESDITTQPSQTTIYSTGIQRGQGTGFIPMPVTEVNPVYSYQGFDLERIGPEYPTEEEIKLNGYLLNIRAVSESERGGGFSAVQCCQRALHDALGGLFHYSEAASTSVI
ncbi:hypothetical protein LOTGIDRAFT_230879 [Lottia gigantea]|uniref:CDK-activating kinase assembly factor MAT1 n=1 Tax=Lottia gigantea TaxID=225164 RepID=V4ART5_LOTGI|nr:hypothetical protein LOTGIDRAFT_230879 [Lottia gigantea]ESO99952.1 hypothetical protein LOTGIDRAFT_230879 [Lottia gigantea]